MEPNALLQQMQWLQSADPSLEYKPPHSQNQASNFDQPHSCAHCQHLCVNAEDLGNKSDRGHRYAHFSLEIGRGLQQAIVASKAGCALFEWFLDTLVENRSRISSKAVSSDQIVFSLEFELSHENLSCAPIIDGLVGSDKQLRVQDGLEPDNLWTSPWSRLDICAQKDDPASNIIGRHPPEFDMFSERSIQFGKDCLATCLKYHGECRTEWLRNDLNQVNRGRYPVPTKLPDETIALSDLPTRLLRIEVSTDESLLVRLVEVSKLPIDGQEQVAAAGFAALSYCWGKEGNPIRLTSRTFKVLKQGISVSKLPATISDAIHFSKQLSVRHIWVDALCIFQDDAQDKETEIMRMGAYYGANTLTLCAASADGSSKGLRHPHTRLVHRVSPLGLRCQVGESVGQIILYSKLEFRDCITERGWTLQESLLSRRMLIFSDQLYWCCATANAECEGTLATLSKAPNRRLGYPESLVPGVYPAQVLRDYPSEMQWLKGTSDFTKRHLGVASDKLLAISAFAAWVDARYRARIRPNEIHVTYVAGLFLSTQKLDYLASQLLWRTSRPSECIRPLKYRAPSWSWAAVDGPIHLQDERKHYIGQRHATCVLEGFDVELTHKDSVYGSVERAVLKLSGCRIQPLQSCLKFPVYFDKQPEDPSSSQEGIYLLPDTAQDGPIIESALGVRAQSALLLCQISRERKEGGGHKRADPSQGLILIHVFGEAPNAFRRAGVVIVYHMARKDKTEGNLELLELFDVEGQNIILL